MRVQRRRGGDDDEKADDVGKSHPHIGIDTHPRDLGFRFPRRLDQWMRQRIDPLLLRFLRRLPEEAIGRDGRAQHGNDRDDILRLEGKIGHERVVGDRTPRHIDRQRGGDVGEQRQAAPFQDRHISIVAGKNLQQHAGHREPDDVQMRRAMDQQCQHVPHRAQIGADVDDVGEQQQAHDDPQQPGRIVRADIAGDPHSGHTADAGADLLDRGHQREGEQHHPAHAKAELCPSLGVGGDAAGIVVRRAGDQPRAEGSEPPLLRRSDRRAMQRDTPS